MRRSIAVIMIVGGILMMTLPAAASRYYLGALAWVRTRKRN
ncbi:MAG TPA: hypothetical protein VLH60_05475 [Sedimentisphaerales bacterium]|nr:hypothetical protein [Sedimentisphaerales bacterium]